jgi:chromosome segregation ATPase
MATLTLHPPDGASVVVELQHDVVTLGRNPDNRIVISSSYISGYHARFNRVKGTDTYEVTDLQSHNGTRINGIRIEKQRLHHGDMIQLGPALLARFEQERPVGAEVPGSLAAHDSAEVKASVTYNGSGHGGRTGTPVAEASLLEEQSDELEQLKVEAKKRRTELRVGEAQLIEVRTERDTLLEAIAEAHREQAKVREATFAQDGVLRSGREAQAELESGIRQLKETQEREREALQNLRAEWAEYAAKHREIQTNLELARRQCLTIAVEAEQQREAQDTMARQVAARREELRSLDKAAKALSEEQELRQAVQAGREEAGAAAKAAQEELRRQESSLAKARLEEKKIRGELEQGRADLAALQETISAHREIQKTLESAMAGLQEKVVASEAGARRAQAGQGKTAVELESIRQALLIAEKERGQPQSLVKEAGQKQEGLQREARVAAELLESRQQAVVPAGDALGKLPLRTQALRRNMTVDQAEWDRTAALRDQQAEREEINGQLGKARAEMVRLTEELETRRIGLKELGEALGAVGGDPSAVLEAFEKIRLTHGELGRAVAGKQADLETLRQAALTQRQELEAACQDLAGVQQQVKDAGARLSQLNQAIAEAEAAASLRQQELDRKLAEGESRLRELESQAAEHRHQIAQPPPLPLPLPLPLPAGPGPATSQDAAKPEDTPGNPTEPAGSIEDELIRLGFRVQPVKKNPGNAK